MWGKVDVGKCRAYSLRKRLQNSSALIPLKNVFRRQDGEGFNGCPFFKILWKMAFVFNQ